MINKDEELEIICLLDENKLHGTVKLEFIRRVIFNYVQVGPMFVALVDIMKKTKAIQDESHRSR